MMNLQSLILFSCIAYGSSARLEFRLRRVDTWRAMWAETEVRLHIHCCH